MVINLKVALTSIGIVSVNVQDEFFSFIMFLYKVFN